MNGTGGAQALGPHPPHTPEPAVASQIIHHLLSPRAGGVRAGEAGIAS